MSFFFLITCCNVFNVWPETTLLLPLWPRDAKRLDTPGNKYLITVFIPGGHDVLIGLCQPGPWTGEEVGSMFFKKQVARGGVGTPIKGLFSAEVMRVTGGGNGIWGSSQYYLILPNNKMQTNDKIFCKTVWYLCQDFKCLCIFCNNST